MNIHEEGSRIKWGGGRRSPFLGIVAVEVARDVHSKSASSFALTCFYTSVSATDREECRFLLGVSSAVWSCCLSTSAVKHNECFLLVWERPAHNSNTNGRS
ncbi:hypothetical protein CDAR_47591 [Caerostris darwini]|uniref:Uncharacterized protein n=1 Tax=Caerostris darwini TaxID=1538125 RepID=A0AAV4M9X3_9ARAC|nr:hypothetical protein CDAR_47591 [Caerostris darwini]